MRGASSIIRWQGLMAILGLSLGCTHQDPADRSLEKLRSDIARIQAERDGLEQRVGALEEAEQRRHTPATPSVTASPQAEPVAPSTTFERKLPVVRVREAEPRESALPTAHSEPTDFDKESDEARPLRGAETRAIPIERRRSKDTSADGAAFSPEAKRAYDSALALVRGGEHEKALAAFTAFLVRFPDHPYAENAMYWRGECFYASGAYDRAVEQFEGLIARFSYGNKAPDALLKLGLSQTKAGAKDQAQKTFAELKDRYPKSEAARQVPRS